MKNKMYKKLEQAEQLLESLTQDLSTYMANVKQRPESVEFFLEKQKEALYKIRCAKIQTLLMKEV